MNSDPHSAGILQGSPANHPAAKAWCAVCPQGTAPVGIETLKERNRPLEKSSVYRLFGVGPAGASVIAKRCRRETALVEWRIYREVLPSLPVSQLTCYGFLEEPDSDYCWLFLEDAGEPEFIPLTDSFRSLVTEWLGTLHTSAVQLSSLKELPDRGSDYYLGRLRLGRSTIEENRGNPLLTAEDLGVLDSILAHLNTLENGWHEVETFSDRMPHTLVHGDFVAKNIRIRSRAGATVLLPLDWETAGWGIPGPDLRDVDPFRYWQSVHLVWTDLQFSDIQRLVHTGHLFRLLTAICWDSAGLGHNWIIKVMGRMTSYQVETEKIIPLWFQGI
jgi:hypothetical protein